MPNITLRYFEPRGRAQFIRGLLTHRDIAFTDERVPLSEDLSSWQETRKDRSISGPFQKLPTLQWDDTMVGEVLVILDFLHHKLGDAAAIGEKESLRHAMLRSSVFLDLLTPCVNLIWCEIFNPGVEIAGATQTTKFRLTTHLATVNQTLSEWGWLDAMTKRPVMAADAMLWESLDAIRLVFDGKVSFSEHEILASFYEECPGRATFQALTETPFPLSAKPGEAQTLAAIQAAA